MTSQKALQPNAANWRHQAFLAAWTLYAGYYICRHDVVTPAAIGSSHIALELACFGATYAIGQFVGGSLADRTSASRTALAGALISVFCTVLQGWASPDIALVLQLANGFGQGLGWPSLLKLIGGWFGPGDRDTVLGWWSSSYILGGFLASVLTQWLSISATDLNIDPFHLLHLVPPAILLVTAIVFAFCTRRMPQTCAPAQANASVLQLSEWEHWKNILRNRSMRYASGMYFFLKMTRYTLLFWLPHYLISAVGYSTYTATRTASYFEIFGMLGPIAVAYATTRVFGRNRMRLCAFIVYGLAFMCLMHPLLAASGFFGMVVSISLLGILIHGSDMLISGMAVLDTMPAEQHGRAVGFVNGIGSIGQAISPLLATLFVAHFGWTKLFDLFVLFTLISGAICAVGARFVPLNGQSLTVQGLSFPALRYNLQRK
ncbi:MFS transporter [Terracidiphilus gabretensis]|jgi:sugar phosphate permease|uniref:MFS transporter n=1 Tax=Terracidiphilus gabretensis TaxID=1577687 RepID=UPI00071B65D0|nr:MFS transporter [Terracidiphilus gabretensis]